MHFDLLVLGSGPAGQKAAVQASKLGKRAAVVERMATLGGVSIHTGTIPSKTLREAVIYLTGYHQRTFYGRSYTVDPDITMSDLMFRAEHVIKNEIEVTGQHLLANGIEVLSGEAAFVDPHTVSVTQANGPRSLVSADRILIATGSEAARDPRLPFDCNRVLTSDDLLRLPEVPGSLAIVGAGIIGTEYAGIFAALGVSVALIDHRSQLLPFVDREVGEALARHLADNGLALHLNEGVTEIDAESSDFVELRLSSGESLRAEAVLYCVGRVGATAALNLPAAGLLADDRGRIPVNANFQTAAPHIYAAGDVTGSPALAATSMEQGRRAACHAFGVPEDTAVLPLPYAIYTVPEIAMLGPTSDELEAAGVDYVAGRAWYREIARGQMLGDETGFLKLLFHTETGRLLAIHALGVHASELIHIGQAVMSFGGGLDYFIDAVFNYPTLAECYKTAALDAANDFRRLGRYASIDMFVPAPPVIELGDHGSSR
jgi:NAD(P) transhydrogenase